MSSSLMSGDDSEKEKKQHQKSGRLLFISTISDNNDKPLQRNTSNIC